MKLNLTRRVSAHCRDSSGVFWTATAGVDVVPVLVVDVDPVVLCGYTKYTCVRNGLHSSEQ